MVGAMLIFVLSDSTVKVISQTLGPFTQTYSRLLMASVVTVVFFYKKIRLKAFLNASPQTIKWVLLTGVIGFGFKAILLTFGLINTKLLNVSSIDSLTPLVVYFYSLFLFKTKFDIRLLSFILISIYGVLVVSTKSLIPIISQFGIGELFITISLFAGAVSIVGRKVLVGKLNNFEIAAYTYILAGLFVFLLTPIFGERFIFFNLNVKVSGLLLFSALCSSLGAILINYALTKLEATLVSQILLTKVIFSLALGFILFRELPLTIELLGSGIIALGVYLSNSDRSLIKEKKI